MVVARPDVVHAGGDVVKKLSPQARLSQAESLLRRRGTKDGRARLAAGLQTQQPFVLRVDVGEQAIGHLQLFGNGRARGGKSQNRIGAVAVIVDQMLGYRGWAGGAVGSDRPPGHRIGGNFLVPGLTSRQVISPLPSASSPMA